MSERNLVRTDDLIRTMDDDGRVHVFEVQPDGSLEELLAPGECAGD